MTVATQSNAEVTLSPEGEAVLRRAVDQIELDPKTWDQSTWVGKNDCGTTACLGGHIVLNEEGLTYRALRRKGTVMPAALRHLGIEPGSEDAALVVNRVFLYITVDYHFASVDSYHRSLLKGDGIDAMMKLKMFKARLTEVFGIDF